MLVLMHIAGINPIWVMSEDIIVSNLYTKYTKIVDSLLFGGAQFFISSDQNNLFKFDFRSQGLLLTESHFNFVHLETTGSEKTEITFPLL